jgi:phosphatidylglycerol:prolipoprotein diacylglycerol transferase
MHPILFTIGSFNVYSWGAVFVATVLSCLFTISKLARSRGISEERLQSAVVILLLIGIIGARGLSVLLNWDIYADRGLLSIINLRSGGLAFHGGLLAGAIALPLISRRLGISIVRFTDILAPVLALGYGIQRLGCLLNGDSYGVLTNGSWGVTTPFAPGLRHPVQLYDSLMNLIIFMILIKLFNRKFANGIITALYLFGSALSRFISEFFREGDTVFFGLTPAQLVSLVIMTGSVLILFSAKMRYRSLHIHQDSNTSSLK